MHARAVLDGKGERRERRRRKSQRRLHNSGGGGGTNHAGMSLQEPRETKVKGVVGVRGWGTSKNERLGDFKFPKTPVGEPVGGEGGRIWKLLKKGHAPELLASSSRREEEKGGESEKRGSATQAKEVEAGGKTKPSRPARTSLKGKGGGSS